MHFAYPPRKGSNPPPFRARTSRIPPLFRRSRLKVIVAGALVFLGFLYLISGAVRSRIGPRVPLGEPPVVIVTVLDETKYSKEFLSSVRDNRKQYAKLHGYEVMFTKPGDYDIDQAPSSWNKVVSLRHAMAKYPEAGWIWYLEQDSYIMNPSTSVENLVLKSKPLNKLMMRDHPVVPPESVIRTFPYLKGEDINFILTQDREGLSSGSFFVRNGEWAMFFLDTWFDPLYRSYNFLKAEGHALEHIVQWHPTILSKLALVPQKTFNSFNRYEKGELFSDGDLVIRAAGCTHSGERACEMELHSFNEKWRAAFKAK